MTEKKTIQWVVEAGLCTQCGWCVPNCPSQAIFQGETPSGYLFPRVVKSKCTLCGLCNSICSGWHLGKDIQDEQIDLFEGPVLEAFCGYANDPRVRSKSQSGGIVSALLSFQLESGCIDRALVTRMPRDGSLRPFAFLAKTSDEVFSAGGSKYCPVQFTPDLSMDLNSTEIISIVGVSCQIHTIRNAQAHTKKQQSQISLTIGLFCDRIMSYLMIQHLCMKVGCAMTNVADFQYRSKERSGWPGEVYIEERTGKKHFLPAQERILIKDIYTPARCRVCFDKMNVLSDLSVGDAHGLRTDKKGYSTILARSKKGVNALRAAEKAGAIVLEPIVPKAVFLGQRIAAKRQGWKTYTAAWENMGRNAPNYHFSSCRRLRVKSVGALRQKKREFHRAERLSNQPTQELALKEALRQFAMQRIFRWFFFGRLRKQVAKRLHCLKSFKSIWR